MTVYFQEMVFVVVRV